MKKHYLLKNTFKTLIFLLLSVIATSAFSQKLTISTAKKWYCPGETAVLEASSGFTKYLWSNKSNDRSIKVTTGGKYAVTAWDSNGKPQSDSIEISFYKTKTNTISTKNNPICKGDSVLLESSAGFKSYIWSTQETTRIIKVAPSATTTYYVYGKDSNGCAVKAIYTLQVKSCGTSSCADLIKWKEKNKCAGDSIQLEAPNGYIYYKWTDAKSNTLTNDRVYWAKEPGMYVLWAKDSAYNYCSDTVYIGNFKTTTLSAGAWPVKNTYCKGDTINFESNKGFASYNWNNQKNDRNFTLIATASVKITLYVVDSNGCKQSKSWEITVKDCNSTWKCAYLIKWKEKAKCPGDSVLLEGPKGYAYYKWSDAKNNTLKNDRIYWAKEPGMYVLWTKDSANNYCSDTVYIGNYKVPTLTAGIWPVKNFYCKGDTIRFESNKGFTAYYWGGTNNDRNYTMIANSSTKITLYVVDSNGCKQSKSWEITVKNCSQDSCDNLITAYPKTTICQGDSVKLLGKEGMASYKWSNNKTDRYFYVKESGIWYLEAKTPGGKTCKDSVKVTVHKKKDFKISTKPNPAIICPGDTIIIEATSGMSKYSWNLGSNYTSNKAVITLKEKKTIVVEAQDSNGCNYRAEVTVKMDTSCSKSSTNPCKEIKVYPNPTSGKIMLEMKDTLNYDMKIEVYDRYSKLLIKDVWKSGNKKHDMNLTSLSNGYYYLKIYCNGGVIIKKIVKQ